MAYQTNIPQATDLISASQSAILGNFQYLGDVTGNAANGYYKFPNGLIIQWGTADPTSGVAYAPVPTTFYKNVSFPIAFPATLYSVNFSNQLDDVNLITISLFPVSVKTMVIKETANAGAVAPTVTGFSLYYNTLSFGPVFWVAIGV